jgi:hypothetical protein
MGSPPAFASCLLFNGFPLSLIHQPVAAPLQKSEYDWLLVSVSSARTFHPCAGKARNSLDQQFTFGTFQSSKKYNQFELQLKSSVSTRTKRFSNRYNAKRRTTPRRPSRAVG